MEKANKTLAAMIRAVDGPKKIPRVVIDVTGGIVQSIISDSPVDVVVYDTDDPPDGGLTVPIDGQETYIWRAFERADVVDPEEIDPYFIAANQEPEPEDQ